MCAGRNFDAAPSTTSTSTRNSARRPASLPLLQSCEIVKVGGTPSPKFGQRVARLSERPSLGCIGAAFFSEKMQHCASSANFSKFANFDVANFVFWEMSQKFFRNFFLSILQIFQSANLANWQTGNLEIWPISQSRNLAIWRSGDLPILQPGKLANRQIFNLEICQSGNRAIFQCRKSAKICQTCRDSFSSG